MNHQEIQLKYRQILDKEHKGREIGKYYASKLGPMLAGWFKPEDFFKKEYDITGCGNMSYGEMCEAHLNKMWKKVGLEFEHEPKKYLRVGSKFITGIHDNWSDDLLIGGHITISVKPDFVFKDFIIETKAPTKRTLARYFDKGEIPYWYKPQLLAEHKAFGLPVKVGVFRDLSYNRFYLQIIDYEPDEELWQKVIKKLVKFDAKLKTLTK